MRSTVDVCVAVQECRPCMEVELRLCIASLCAIQSFLKRDLRKLCEVLEKTKTESLRVKFTRDMMDMISKAAKQPMDEWLGPLGTPGTDEQVNVVEISKRIIKETTGIDLDIRQE